MTKQVGKNGKIIKGVIIISTILIILGIVFLLYGDNYNKLFRNNDMGYACEKIHKGRNMSGECHVKDDKSIEENIYNLHFEIPGQNNLFITKWKKEGSIVINEEIKDEATIELYIEKINKYSSGSEFTMPFRIKHASGEVETYLGFFGLFDINKHGPGYKFYESTIRHADSMLLGGDIKIGETKNGKSGVHDNKYYGASNHLVIQEYFKEGSGDKKELRIRTYKDESKLRLDGECDQDDALVIRKRGDVKEYEVCVSKSKGECELETYRRGNCPLAGFDVSELNEEETYCYITGNMPRKKDGICYIIMKSLECPFEGYFNGTCGN